MSYFDDFPIGRLVISSGATIGTLAGATGVTVAHKQCGPMVRTTLTLASVPQTIANGVEYAGTHLWSFPAADIRIEAVSATLQQKTTSIIADTLNASSTGAVGIGTTTAVSTTLATTTQNLIPTTAFTSSATINVAGTAVTPKLGTGVYADSFVLDGDPTAVQVYLNTAFATTGDVDADATITWTGSVVITWTCLGSVFAAI